MGLLLRSGGRRSSELRRSTRAYNLASMRRVRLIHWNKSESATKAKSLRSAGYQVGNDPVGPAVLRALQRNPPDAVVIDLSRMPMQGRDVGLAVRHFRASRHVALVFVEGDPEKVARVKQQLPDAVYTTWRRIRGSLKRAIARPPEDPVAVNSLLAGYSGTPLPKKLGIKENSVVALINAPKDFETTLVQLPAGVVLRRTVRGRSDLTVWFTTSKKDLDRRVERLGKTAGKGGLWIAWPKKASGVATDLTPAIVRETGLACGLVDYKICAVDEIWSGLRFAVRRR